MRCRTAHALARAHALVLAPQDPSVSRRRRSSGGPSPWCSRQRLGVIQHRMPASSPSQAPSVTLKTWSSTSRRSNGICGGPSRTCLRVAGALGSSPCLSQLSAATIEVALADLEGPIVSTPSRNDSLSNFKTCAREPNGNEEKAHASWIGPPYGRGGAQPLELQLDLDLEPSSRWRPSTPSSTRRSGRECPTRSWTPTLRLD